MQRMATASWIPKRSIPFLIGKILILQILFYQIATQGPYVDGALLSVITVCILLINYFFIRRLIQLKHYLVMMALFYFSGFIQDTILIYFNKLDFGSIYPPLYVPCLWLLFLAYYGDVFRKMLTFPFWLSAILGSLGGTLAYHRALGPHNVIPSNDLYIIVAIIWSLYMPLSLRLFRYFMELKTPAKA